ncbi:MAG: hypothetical protein GF383_06500 [Candidatus Lokiarchaeota archaeon]|nr:hypothetical protein [Candidatus Lokiarchaeota archaeon]MBD3339705.1 hypothetical protein [Candidatus Lokiarchaeota archaeon]
MDKEEWDLDKFIKFYNKIAHDAAGWMYEENRSNQELKEEYEQSADDSIQEFAKNLLYYEQRH